MVHKIVADHLDIDRPNNRSSGHRDCLHISGLPLDTIYRRAADLLRIDEALLRLRSKDEFPEMQSKRGLAEALQLVHYDVGQECK